MPDAEMRKCGKSGKGRYNFFIHFRVKKEKNVGNLSYLCSVESLNSAKYGNNDEKKDL